MRRSTRRLFLLRLLDVVMAGGLLGLPSLAGAAAVKSIVSRDVAVLRLLCRRILPLRRIGERSYDQVIRTLQAQAGSNPELARLLADGSAQMRKDLGRGWRNAKAPVLTDYLRRVEATHYFKALHDATLFTLINQPTVWAATGYEGESFSKNGYLGRGFNDLKWLPEPPASVMGPVP
ncbi:MAG: hypothetical protein D4R84_01630 [Rhodocyclaceae bacterium]|nr:MAG: hypothetical protein D4R84_01630 [Rhodocyclaceae bacterium]